MTHSTKSFGVLAATVALAVTGALTACTTNDNPSPTPPASDHGSSHPSADSDHYQGKEVWEVEVTDSNQGRIEVKVEKATGTILHMDVDD